LQLEPTASQNEINKDMQKTPLGPPSEP